MMAFPADINNHISYLSVDAQLRREGIFVSGHVESSSVINSELNL
jgi:hypothetical protein